MPRLNKDNELDEFTGVPADARNGPWPGIACMCYRIRGWMFQVCMYGGYILTVNMYKRNMFLITGGRHKATPVKPSDLRRALEDITFVPYDSAAMLKIVDSYKDDNGAFYDVF